MQYFLDWDKTLKENPTLPVLIVRYEDLKKVRDGLFPIEQLHTSTQAVHISQSCIQFKCCNSINPI